MEADVATIGEKFLRGLYWYLACVPLALDATISVKVVRPDRWPRVRESAASDGLRAFSLEPGFEFFFAYRQSDPSHSLLYANIWNFVMLRAVSYPRGSSHTDNP